MEKARLIYQKLMEDFDIKNAKGQITFNLNDISIIVRQNDVVGNILEEWVAKWMTENNIPHIHNEEQASPDIWLNPDDLNSDWLEIKSFAASPGFDIAAYNSFINLILKKPYKLQSSYLLIRYKMEDGIVSIVDCWLKKVWEICSPSEKWPIKVQYKSGVITNIRPATWYATKTKYPIFESLEDFLSALEEVVYTYPDTHSKGATWKKELIASYKKHYGVTLDIPRWADIKSKYIPEE
jgi:NgoBV restriction endonuclease